MGWAGKTRLARSELQGQAWSGFNKAENCQKGGIEKMGQQIK